MKAFFNFCESPSIFIKINNFFKLPGTGDRTTDPWITRPVLYPYTMGTHDSGKFILKNLIPLLGCMLAMQSRCKCITAWLQTKEMAFIVHTTVGSYSKAILIADRVRTGLLFQDYDIVNFCFNVLIS